MKKKPGRPKRHDALKNAVVPVRVNAAEKEAFVAAADLAGLPLASWVRMRLRKASAKELTASGKPVAFLES